MIKNFLSLFFSFSFINLIDRIIPLITIPILTNNLGMDGFGKYVVILSYTVLFDSIISFGFKTSAIVNLKKCSRVLDENIFFYKILFSKLVLTVPIFFCLLFVLWYYDFKTLFSVVFSLFILVGIAINQEWYFHGKGKMKSVIMINFFFKIIYLGLIYFLVRGPEDVFYALVIYSIITFFKNFFGTITAVLEFKIKLAQFIKFEDIVVELKRGSFFFMASLSSYFYSSFNLIIIDFFYSPFLVGIYAIADKIINVARDISNIFNSSVLPFFSDIYGNKKTEKNNQFVYYNIFIFTIFSFLGLLIFLNAENLFIYFNSSIDSVNLGTRIIRTLVISLPFLVIIGSISQYYLIKKQSKKLFFILFFFSLTSILTLSLIGYTNEITGFTYAYISLITLLFLLLLINLPASINIKK